MLKCDPFVTLTTDEIAKRNDMRFIIRDNVDDLNNRRIALLNCKEQARWLNERIRYCKKHIPDVFSPMRKELWESPNLWDPATDFSLGAKAYAYLLYYRQQMNGVQKIIKRLKAELSYRNKMLSKKQNELTEYDDMLNTKYQMMQDCLEKV